MLAGRLRRFADSRVADFRMPGMDERQPSPAIAQLQSRVERLLLRHNELLRTNALLAERVQSLEAERDQMRQRLHDATQRIDRLLARLDQTPSISGEPDPHA